MSFIMFFEIILVKLIITKLQKYLLNIILLSFFLGACSRKLILKENEYLLYFQGIKGVKSVPKEDLALLFKQRPNKQLFGIPLSLYMYNFGKSRLDTNRLIVKRDIQKSFYDSLLNQTYTDTTKHLKKLAKIEKKLKKAQDKVENGNFFMRVLGSKPIVYDSMLAKNTQKQLIAFYKTKGFFKAKVNFKTDTISDLIFLNYDVYEANRINYSKINYIAQDALIKRIINEYSDETILHTYDWYDEDKIIKERERIEKILKNNGYFDFSKKYILFEIDTTNSNCIINCFIKNPENGEIHKTYKMDSIQFDIDNSQSADYTLDTTYHKDMLLTQTIFFYKPKVLRSKIQFAPNQLYNMANLQLTQRTLSQLEMFRFVSINFKKDTTNNSIKPYIATNSLSKYQISDELGFSISQGVPGPFGSITFTNRNALGGCEVFDLSLRAGIEGVASQSRLGNIYTSYDIGATASLTFPRLLSIINLNTIFVNNNPRTRFSLGYNFILRPEYQRTNTRFAMTYTLQKGIFKSFSLALIDFNYIRSPRLDPVFQQYLDNERINGNTLYRTFQNAIFTNLNFAYIYNTFELGKNKKSVFFRIYAEPGGTWLNLLSNNHIKDLKTQFGVESAFIYWKASVDFRGYLPITKKSTFATRIQIGVANPYGLDKVMPYERYFFTGGSNSNRAWSPRRLGPGSFSGNLPSELDPSGYKYEQPGLVLLELNEEYRFKIYKFFDAAFFVDAGNVWTLDDADNAKNLKIESVSEIAIGAGTGIRLDFSFLIVRLDTGFKIYDPAQPIGQRWVAHKQVTFDNAQWNIAIGYPF